MQRFFTVLTLTCLMLTFFVSDAAHAMQNGDVDVAEKNITADKDGADIQYLVMLNTNTLYAMAKSEYEANESRIKRGRIVTSAKLVAATVTVFVSGTVSATVAVSTLISMLDLEGAIDASTPLLSAYETAISSRFNEIEEFEILSTAYTNTYNIYIGKLAGHTGWTESYLFTYIANEYNRRQGIQHNGSSPSDKHGIEEKKEWGEYDKTFPAYPCEGPCTVSYMTPTSDHEIKCGGPNDPSSSKVGGCGVRYYSCDTVNAAAHEPGTCMTQKWHRTWNRGPNGESVPVWVLVNCGEWTRMCFVYMGGHASPADPGNNNFSMMHSTQPIDDDSTEQDTQGLQTEQTPTPTPSMHACGVHEDWQSGDHSAASCGTSGHYACDSNNHSAASCGISGHYTCNSVEHVSLTCPTDSNGQSCDYGSYYACSPHTHSYPAPPEPEPSLSVCINGHSYDPNNSSANNRHRTKTCRFEECGQSWANCSGNAPICNKPYRKANGLRCWAID